MRDSDSFDAFYADARGRLLLQAYALTGDLSASRDAVRGAFAAAWHHWPKVSKDGDPESWVRPEIWRRARRRHQARPWHRERVLDDEARETLEALGALSVRQRKTLLLTQLSTVTTREMAREVGLTLEVAERQLLEATEQVCATLSIGPDEIRARLEALAVRLGETRFPEAARVRRSGATRRRLHAVGGVVASAALVLGAGQLVHDVDAVSPALGGQQAGSSSSSPAAEARLQRRDMLTRADVEESLPKRRAKGNGTLDNNTNDTGIYTPCQTTPFAVTDDAGEESQALVRRIKFKGKQRGRVLQSVEVAPDASSAQAAFTTMSTWFTDCQTPRAQLLSVHRLKGMADQGLLVTIRTWDAPDKTHQAAVVRTGRLVSLVLVDSRGNNGVSVDDVVDLAESATNRLCESAVAATAPGACATAPEARLVPPPRPNQAVGMLQVLDLPPVTGAPEPWVGVKPVKAVENHAATRCDRTTFTGRKMKRARTRTFVILEAGLPNEFGITETMGRLPNDKAAKAFVKGVRDRMSSCADDDLTVTVTHLGHRAGAREEVTWWRVETEVSDTRTLTQLMAVTRRGNHVAQIGFTPTRNNTLASGGFDALAVRAMKRLGNVSGS